MARIIKGFLCGLKNLSCNQYNLRVDCLFNDQMQCFCIYNSINQLKLFFVRFTSDLRP